MASEVDICNIGLSHIGAEAQVASISPPDGSVEAGYCARFYPIARKELLEDQPWSFAKRRVQLVEVTNTSTVWAYAYAVPSAMISALRVLRLKYINDASLLWPAGSYLTYNFDWRAVDELFTERGSSFFEIEDGVLRTNEPEATLLYTVDVTDTTKFSPKFVGALGMLMAGYLAGPIIKGTDGATIGARWRQAAYAMSANAAASNANSSNETATHVAEHVRARA
jgi:hypothetical protein